MKTLAFVLALTSLLASGAAQAITERKAECRRRSRLCHEDSRPRPTLTTASPAVDALTGAAQTPTILQGRQERLSDPPE